MLFINHSCDPNAGFAGNIVLVAMRDIRPGAAATSPGTFSAASRTSERTLGRAAKRWRCLGGSA